MSLRLLIFLLITLLTITVNAASACSVRVDTKSIWHYNGGVLAETTVAKDGFLDLRFSVRTDEGSDPEYTIDLIYGGFYIGDLADFLTSPYPINNLESFRDFLANNQDLVSKLNKYLHTYDRQARIEAIDQLWNKLETGLKITYDFTIYKEKIAVIGPKVINHILGERGKLNTIVVEVERFIRDKKIATSTYWFESGKNCRLVQWGHDMGSEYYLEILQPDGQQI